MKRIMALFQYHGNVLNAFIPNNKSKNGMRFGFVRFSRLVDTQRAIARPNGFELMGRKIWVKKVRLSGKRKIWKKKFKHR